MTARTTTLKGGDAGAYYVEKELGYYLDRGEPQGRWQGRGAPSLELGDTVDEESFLSLMAGEDPRTGRLLGTRHTDKTDRGFDVTCSAPKGVSVLFALGDGDVRREVLEAHDTAVAAMVDWIERHAHTRYRVNGQIRTFDAEGILVANFRHHTSRALDPQVHTHSVVVNRVMSPDGRWLALDARTIKKDQQTLSRLYHSGLRAEMTRRLGVRWIEPSNGIAEIADIPTDVLREFSQRTEAIDRRIDEKIDRFEDANDREPTLRERWRLEREAVLDTRPHKEGDTDPIALEENWRDRLLGLGLTPDELVAEATGHERGLDRIDDAARARIAEQALDAHGRPAVDVARRRGRPGSGRRSADHRRHAGRRAGALGRRPVRRDRPHPHGRPVVAGTGGGAPPPGRSTDHRVGRRPGADHARHPRPGGTTPAAGREALRRRGSGPPDRGHRRTHARPSPARHRSGRRPPARPRRRPGRHRQDHGAPTRQSNSSGAKVGWCSVSPRPRRPPRCWPSTPASTPTPSTSSSSSTASTDHPTTATTCPPARQSWSTKPRWCPRPKLAELFDLAEERDWRLVLVGDPMQFSAVGRSGMFGHLVDSFDAIELDRVHRFNHAWEAKASLRLRRGDTDRRRGLRGTRPPPRRDRDADASRGGRRLVERRSSGARPPALMAPTNAAVVELNQLGPVASSRRRPARPVTGRRSRSVPTVSTSGTGWPPATTTAGSGPTASSWSRTGTGGPSTPSTGTAA